MMLIIIGLIGFLTYFLISKLINKPKLNLPPGPLSLPLIGSLISFFSAHPTSLVKAYLKLSKSYGTVFSITLGQTKTVVVTSYDGIKELQSNDNFMNRFEDKFLFERSYGKIYGLIASKDKYWQETRRFTHRLLRDSGFGQNAKMEKILTQVLSEFITNFKLRIQKSGSFEFGIEFNTLFLAFLWTILSGESVSIGHPTMTKLIMKVEEVITLQRSGGGIATMYPWIYDNFPSIGKNDLFKEKSILFHAYVDEIIREIVDKNEVTDNFFWNFINEIKKNEGKYFGTYDTIFNYENLNMVLQDLIIAGNDTQANTMKFGIRFLLQNPKVQKNCQAEIERVVGKRSVQFADYPELKYVQATLFEILRMSTVVYTIPRKAKCDSKIGEYDIPAGTTVVPLYYASNMDETQWVNPNNFDPERFLNQNGELCNYEKNLAFGFGRRNCMGETVAKKILLMVLSTLLQNFTFEIDPSFGMPDDDFVEGMTLAATKFKMSIKIR